MLRPLATLVCAAALALASSSTACADDGELRFHRTTPRAAVAQGPGVVILGVPGGRAWGIESELRALPDPPATLVVRLEVRDQAVREAFVRVAYYGSATSRGRQLATTDSEPVGAGERSVTIGLRPPPGAVAYRVRVLARLADPSGRSADDAVVVRLRAAGRGGVAGPRYSELLP